MQGQPSNLKPSQLTHQGYLVQYILHHEVQTLQNYKYFTISFLLRCWSKNKTRIKSDIIARIWYRIIFQGWHLPNVPIHCNFLNSQALGLTYVLFSVLSRLGSSGYFFEILIG